MEPKLPRVAITYCTQCRWMLRAAYFGQELLSTFGTTIGETALIPATGGIFTVHLTYQKIKNEESDSGEVEATTVMLWDRKTEGGFPEAKILKQRVRDHLDPARNLGHSDTPSNSRTSKDAPATKTKAVDASTKSDGTVCEDCG